MNKIVLALFCALVAVNVQGAPSVQPETVAVIGTGDLGGSLGQRLAVSGYRVIYGSRKPEGEAVQDLVRRSGAAASAVSQKQAAAGASIVILAVPWPPMEYVAQNLGNLDGKVILDVSVPYQQAEDGYMESSVATSSAELIQSWNLGAFVVKGGLPGSYLVDNPLALGEPATALLAADIRVAKEVAAQLIASIGLIPLDAGPLRNARYIESLGLLYMVPMLQGRKEGWEFFVRGSNVWPCSGDTTTWFPKPLTDRENLAKFPKLRTVEPCKR